MTGKLWLLSALALALTACAERTEEEVVSNWTTDGTPKEVRVELGEGLGVEAARRGAVGRERHVAALAQLGRLGHLAVSGASSP